MRPVLLATCAAFPDGDEDAPALLAALRARGVDRRFAVWNDPAVDWSGALTVLRSTWDYTLHRAEFLDWAAAVPALHNPAEVVLWNSDKVYLHELEDAGVPVTPTQVVPPGAAPKFPDDAEFVVKPSVGAGSRGAGRFARCGSAQAAAHAAALHAAGRTVLVQPYLADVDEAGETALIYFGGEFSHAIRKGPMLTADTAHDIDETSGLFIEENISARTPSAAELAVGARAVEFLRARFGGDLLYARIDLLPGPSGPVVVEVELTEPSLFLSYSDGAADRFADAIIAARGMTDDRSRQPAERRAAAGAAPDEGDRRRPARARRRRLRRVPRRRARRGAWGYVEAAAEASMVGGLADWFAVTALFRYPLGLRIPHTAIIPNKKDQIGAGLAGFVQEYFLTSEIVAERVAAAQVPHRVGEWLADPGPCHAGRRGAEQCDQRSRGDPARQRAARRRRDVRRQAAARARRRTAAGARARRGVRLGAAPEGAHDRRCAA